MARGIQGRLWLGLAGWAGAAALLAAIASCGESTTPGPARTLAHASPLLVTDSELWERLPPNTIALTYDDGPDTYSLALAQYLASESIPATFFVVGCRIQGQTTSGSTVCSEPAHFPASILGEYVALGHRIGNHTLHHWNVTTLSPRTLHDELAATQAILDPVIADGVYIFRAPGHAWNGSAAQAVRQFPDLDKLWGSYSGGIDKEDWSCADPAAGSHPNMTPEACAQLYVNAIDASNTHGGVLNLHDRNSGSLGTDFQVRLT